MAAISRHALLRGAALTTAALALPETAHAALGSSATADGKGREHPNVKLIRGYYEAYAANDLAALRTKYFAPDIRWTIQGHHPLAGTKRGADEVLAFFAELAKA